MIGRSKEYRLRFFPALLLITCACSGTPQQGPDLDRLESAISRRLDNFEGEVGVYFRHQSSGKEVALRADEVFPTASMIKVPILGRINQQIEAGELDPATELTYSSKRAYPGEDLLESFRDGEPITISKLIDLMIRYSDNTASLWLQELAGSGTEINRWLAGKGFSKTRVNSRTPGREAAYEEHGWGQTTPREMATLLTRIFEGQLVSPRRDEQMYRVLCGSYWRDEMLSRFPPWVQVASKQGAVNRSRSEVVVVNGPGGDFVLCVITRDQKDTSWGHDNAGFVLLRDIAELCWRSLHPDSSWSPSVPEKGS